METIGLQENARPLPGTIEHYWFENERVGLARTLFHRIRIPFEPFDSGLDHVPQPERTERLQSGGLATTGQEPMSTTVAVPVRVAPRRGVYVSSASSMCR